MTGWLIPKDKNLTKEELEKIVNEMKVGKWTSTKDAKVAIIDESKELIDADNPETDEYESIDTNLDEVEDPNVTD